MYEGGNAQAHQPHALLQVAPPHRNLRPQAFPLDDLLGIGSGEHDVVAVLRRERFAVLAKVTLLPDPGPGGKLNTDLEGRDDKADEAAIFAGIQGTVGCVAADLGVTPTQLKTWRLELEAAGSAAATAAQKAEAAELVQLRRDNKRLTEEVEVLRKASAFFAQWAAKT